MWQLEFRWLTPCFSRCRRHRLQVYAGRMHGMHPVAIKVMTAACVPHQQHSFWREAEVLRRCRHPNIVQLLGAYSGTGGSGEQLPPLELVENVAPSHAQRAQQQWLMVVTELLPSSLQERLQDADMRWHRR